MQTNRLTNEIYELNLAYLMLAQRLIHEDRATAMFRLKIDDETAELMSRLNARQLARLAGTSQLLCHFGADSAAQLRQLTQNPREQGLSQFHTALVMASRSSALLAGGK